MKLSYILRNIKVEIGLTQKEKELINRLDSEYKTWISSLSVKEKYLLRKYTYNSLDDDKPNRFFERLNRAMRGDYKGKDKEKLLTYGKIISNAISRQSVQLSFTCYRGTDDDLTSGLPAGATFTFDQFISTSVVERCALKKRFKYVILIPTGTKGVYIDHISAFKGQYEFLLDYECEYRFIRKEGRVVYLEVIV